MMVYYIFHFFFSVFLFSLLLSGSLALCSILWPIFYLFNNQLILLSHFSLPSVLIGIVFFFVRIQYLHTVLPLVFLFCFVFRVYLSTMSFRQPSFSSATWNILPPHFYSLIFIFVMELDIIHNSSFFFFFILSNHPCPYFI